MRTSYLIALLVGALLACAFCLAPGTASAQSSGEQGWTDTAVVVMIPGQEPNLTTPIPSGQSPMGAAIVQMNSSSSQVCYQLWVSGVSNVTQAHFHQGSPGSEGPAVAWLYPSNSSNQPSNVANTTKNPGNFTGLLVKGNVSASDLIGPMKGKNVTDLIDAIKGGQIYVNVHTIENPGGEIRAQINDANIWKASLVVPMSPLEEPSLTNVSSTWNITGMSSGSAKPSTSLVGQNIGAAPWGIGLVQHNGSNVHYALWTFNIANVTQAHFHMGPMGMEGPVVAWLYPKSDATAPANISASQVGVMMNGKLIEGNVSDANLVGAMKNMSVDSLLAAMNNGSIYINVHTTQNPGGEIRGQVDPVNMTCGKAATSSMPSSGSNPTPSPSPAPTPTPRYAISPA